MDIERVLHYLFRVEIVLLSLIMAGIMYFPADEAASYRLYEFLGAIMASMITTFGLKNMKRLTED